MKVKAKTKKITIYLSALTKVEYSEEVEVKDDITEKELNQLVWDKYDSVEGGDYEDDREYWERSYCSWQDGNEETEIC